MRVSEKNENERWAKDHQPPPPPGAQKTIGLTFPKSARIRTKNHYQNVLKARKRFMGDHVLIDYRRGNSSCSKLGITVARRFGKAILRNRFKRVVRDAFRTYRPLLPSDVEINIAPRYVLTKIERSAILEKT